MKRSFDVLNLINCEVTCFIYTETEEKPHEFGTKASYPTIANHFTMYCFG